MRRRTPRDTSDDELTMAVGLVWGHLHAQQPEQAYRLAQGCLELWPDDAGLALMAAFAATELAEPIDLARLRGIAAQSPDAAAFVALVERRAAVAGPGAQPAASI
jgi:uncharacterized protein (DUF1684 family)